MMPAEKRKEKIRKKKKKQRSETKRALVESADEKESKQL